MNRRVSLLADPARTYDWQRRSRQFLPRRSHRRGEFDRSLADGHRAVLRRSDGRCEARFSPRCSGRLDHIHHRQGRKGTGCNAPVLLLAVCWECHRAIHDEPSASYARGLLLHTWDAPTPYDDDWEDA